MTIGIRQRIVDDWPALEQLARTVHETDGYPPYLPDSDYLGFLQYVGADAAWVAVEGDRIVGHVALNSSSSDEVIAIASEALGVKKASMAVVARLLVDPARRGRGTARTLLSVATDAAYQQGRRPILDVVDRFAPAIALYEAQGWERLGTITLTMPDATSVTEHVYAAPPHE